MVCLYADASYSEKDKVACCTVIVLSQVNYLGLQTCIFESIEDGTLAEMLSIRTALEYVKTLDVKPKELIRIRNDNRTAVNYSCTDLSNNVGVKESYRSVSAEIRELSKDLNVEFKVITGHSSNRNPNTVVDVIARKHLRMNINK